MTTPEAPVKEVIRETDIDVEEVIDSVDDILAHPEKEPYELPLGPLKTVHAFWLAGMSCDGCSIAAVGATQPSVESLLLGSIPGMPKLILHHPVLSVEAGEAFVHNFELAEQDELDAPYVIVFEGSVPNEELAAPHGGYWSGLGAREVDGEPQPIPTAEWLRRMAPNAAAVIAIGTCATWGGIPAAVGNPTDAMGVMDFLGEDYRSTFGLPVVNIPGCSPVGDNFTETVAAVLLFLQGLGPLPEFDELGRPAWLFGETVHRGCTRAGFYEEGSFAENYGDKECLVEIGCWGPVVQCNINRRGAINHVGGCMNVGSPCIGCTMPSFPDGFSPFYKKPPGTFLSSNTSKVYGAVIRRLRESTQFFRNRSRRWEEQGHVPNGWGHVREPYFIDRLGHYFYQKMQFTGGKKPGSLPKSQKQSE
jgi:hydrogenase small subunit